jgi:hypothetical protein
MPTTSKESIIQSKIKAHLVKNGWLVNKIIQSTNNGWPDLECFKNGKTIFIEAKDDKNAAPLQKYRHKLLKQQGFEVYVIKSIDELNKFKTNVKIC